MCCGVVCAVVQTQYKKVRKLSRAHKHTHTHMHACMHADGQHTHTWVHHHRTCSRHFSYTLALVAYSEINTGTFQASGRGRRHLEGGTLHRCFKLLVYELQTLPVCVCVCVCTDLRGGRKKLASPFPCLISNNLCEYTYVCVCRLQVFVKLTSPFPCKISKITMSTAISSPRVILCDPTLAPRHIHTHTHAHMLNISTTHTYTHIKEAHLKEVSSKKLI
jgi:hypothetical protein